MLHVVEDGPALEDGDAAQVALVDVSRRFPPPEELLEGLLVFLDGHGLVTRVLTVGIEAVASKALHLGQARGVELHRAALPGADGDLGTPNDESSRNVGIDESSRSESENGGERRGEEGRREERGGRERRRGGKENGRDWRRE